MTENDIRIISREEYQDNEGYTEQKIIFDNNMFEQIKGKELDLSINKILNIPKIKNLFKIHQDEYYVVSQKEHVIDCKHTEGKARIPIINKAALNKEIQAIKSKNPINYVHLGATEILIKACFREGIDTPIEIYLADDRIKEPIEKSVITAVKGNLIYQKFKFTISANYSVSMKDTNINDALVLYWKMSGIKLAPGSKVFTARCKNLYILTHKHKIEAKNRINRIQIDNPFDKIMTIIDKNDYSYNDIDMEELEIVQQRLSTHKRMSEDTPSTSSKMSTSRRIEYTSDKISTSNYYISGILDQKQYLIIVDTGQIESSITRDLVREEEIITREKLISDLPKELTPIEERAQKELIIGGIPIIIFFKIHEGNNNIILGINWLESVKPYNIEAKQLTIHYARKKIIIKRTII